MNSKQTKWFIRSLSLAVLCPLFLVSTKATEAGAPSQAPTQVNEIVTSIVLQNIPHTFEDRRQWGMKSERWDGLKISLDGLRIKTKRRKKEVNHGTWKMYRVQLFDPQNSFRVNIENIRERGSGFVDFDVVATAKLLAFGRVSRWVKGVQLFSLSTDAHATVRLKAQCRLAMNLDITKFPPDLLLAPAVRGAELELVEFKVVRVSRVGGEVAQQMGRGIRRVLEKKMAEYQPKLVTKMNAGIAKHRDMMRLSLGDKIPLGWDGLADLLNSGT